MSLLILLLTCTVCLSAHSLGAQSTEFTYQGRLQHGGSAADGIYEMYFALYDAPTNGTPVGTTVAVAPLPVSHGLFTATLDFGGSAFTGGNRWLEISVTVFGTDQPVVTLAPRQPLTPTPYALHAYMAEGLMSLGEGPLDIKVNGVRALRLEGGSFNPEVAGAVNLMGGSPENLASPVASGITIAGGGAASYYGQPAVNSAQSDFATIGGGGGNLIQSQANGATIAGGFRNTILTEGVHSTIGGGTGNTIADDAHYATIAGGRQNATQGSGSVIAGGQFNSIEIGEDESAGDSVIGGGSGNRTKGDVLTIAGGTGNRAAVLGATVGGGGDNVASNYYAVVSGGTLNKSIGDYSTVPGGMRNLASGAYSFAAGLRAQALHVGAFVWSDASGHDPSQLYTFDSEATNEFAVRATGGVRFVTAIDNNGTNLAGVTLAPGSGTWSSLSDRHSKENLVPADTRAILDKVATLPMASWNYKAQGAGVRHLGPMAQDFHAIFGLGDNDRAITTVDADGVALAAIQGLNAKLEEELQQKETEIQELRRNVAELKLLVDTLAQARK